MNRIKLFESDVKRMEEEIMRQNMKKFYCEEKLKEMERIFVLLYIREQKEAKEIGYPVLVRPSYVLGGQGMEITYEERKLASYLKSAFERDKRNPVLIDKYLVGREIEVDAICDGEEILIPDIMEHLERAGVHSGDSITMYQRQNISEEIKEKGKEKK